jgi:hypothetical protein
VTSTSGKSYSGNKIALTTIQIDMPIPTFTLSDLRSAEIFRGEIDGQQEAGSRLSRQPLPVYQADVQRLRRLFPGVPATYFLVSA